jgi:hypothetical protein
MRNRRLFYLKFPILSALGRELKWTHLFYSHEFEKSQQPVGQLVQIEEELSGREELDE